MSVPTTSGVYLGELPPDFHFGRCILKVADAVFDTARDNDPLPESEAPKEATLILSPSRKKMIGVGDTLYRVKPKTLTATNGVFDFWAIDPRSSNVEPNDWFWRATLLIDGVQEAAFTFSPDSKRSPDDPYNLKPLAQADAGLGEVSAPTLQQFLDALAKSTYLGDSTKDFRGQGDKIIGLYYGGVVKVDLTGDANLEFQSHDRASLKIKLTANGHSLNIKDHVTAYDEDGLITLVRVDNTWYGGMGVSQAVQMVNPLPPIFRDFDEEGGGTFTIPDVIGVIYRIEGMTKTPGLYTVEGDVNRDITITAEPASDRYVFTGSAVTSWTHQFKKSSVSIVSSVYFNTLADDTKPIVMSNGVEMVTYGSEFGKVKNGAFSIQSPSPDMAGITITAAVPLLKERVVCSYDLDPTASDSNNQVSVGIDIGQPGYGERVAAIVYPSGLIQIYAHEGFTWTTLDLQGISAPKSGQIWVEFDAPNATFSVWLNSEKLGSITSSDYTQKHTPVQANGPIISMYGWDQKINKITSITVLEVD